MKLWASSLLAVSFIAGITGLCWYMWLHWPYPPTIVATAGIVTYLALAYINWPLEAWTFLLELRSRSDQLRDESVPLLGTLCSTLGALDGCRYRHVHWGELTEKELACALMNLRGYYVVTERLLRTIRAGWNIGLVISVFIALLTIVIYLNNTYDRTWLEVYKETIITIGVTFALQVSLYLTLIVLRRQNKQVERLTTNTIRDLHSTTTNPTAILTFFRDNTPALLQWIRDYNSIKHQIDYPMVVQMLDRLKTIDDIMKTNINQQFSTSKYFDYHSHEQVLSFSEQYAEIWERHVQARGLNNTEKLTVYYLFLLHEFFHLSQNISSYRYHFTDHALRPLLTADYLADALSILALYELYTQYHPPGWRGLYTEWNKELASLIKLAIVGMEVFTAQDYDEYPLKSLHWFSFHRYLQWHFQYARAQQFLTNGRSIQDVDLLMIPEFALGANDDLDVWYHRSMHFSRPELMVVGWNAKLYEFHSENSEFAYRLVHSVLQGDIENSSRLFGDFFYMHPGLIGR